MVSLQQLDQDLPHIEKKIGYTFKKKDLLKLAFIHRSFANEHRSIGCQHNERLEFLGDAILGMIVSDYLYAKLPTYPEGELSYLRSRLVEASSCANYVQKIEVGAFLLLGRGEAMNQGKGRSSILADLFEAVMGALHLDGGMLTARSFFLGHFQKEIAAIIEQPHRNWKAELQDFCQKTYHEPPEYTLLREEGPDHLKVFYIVVYIRGRQLGEGKGSSKKEAEQMAAEQAIARLGL